MKNTVKIFSMAVLAAGIMMSNPVSAQTDEYVEISLSGFGSEKRISKMSYETRLDKMLNVEMQERYRETSEGNVEVLITMFCLKSELVRILCQE